MNQRIFPSFATLVFALICLPFFAQTDDSKQEAEKKVIESLLTSQDKAWNDGNLEAFMATYWKSPELTFSGGGKTTRGWRATLDRYKKSYPRDKMGKLNFDGLETTLLSPNVAMVLGNWHLDNKGVKADGNFSLIMKKFDDGWKIVHDHSSTLEKEKGWMTIEQATEVGRNHLKIKKETRLNVSQMGSFVRISEFDEKILAPAIYVNRKTGELSAKKPDLENE